MERIDAVPRLPMKGDWNCNDPVGFEKEIGRKSATSTNQHLDLT